jgi:hypothetical protein
MPFRLSPGEITMSTRDLTRTIFGTFRDLNLITLIQDLRQGRVARSAWIEEGRLCPLAHGFRGGLNTVGLCDDGKIDLMLGLEHELTESFMTEWDGGRLQDADLLAELLTLWRERLADNDAVQAVLTARSSADKVTTASVRDPRCRR